MRVLPWIPAVLMGLLIFSFSHLSSPPGADLGPDYLLHACAYAGLGLSLVWGFTAALRRTFEPSQAFCCWLVAVGYGVLDEFHQWFIPMRTATLADVLADAAGAGLAILVAYHALKWAAARRVR